MSGRVRMSGLRVGACPQGSVTSSGSRRPTPGVRRAGLRYSGFSCGAGLKGVRQALRLALRTVFDAATMEHARKRLAEVVAKWRPRHEELADKLESETEDCLACFHFPAGHRIRIRTTNMMERVNEAFRSRTRVA